MKVIVDKEAKIQIEILCDIALKTQGLKAYQVVKKIEQVLQIETEDVPSRFPGNNKIHSICFVVYEIKVSNLILFREMKVILD